MCSFSAPKPVVVVINFAVWNVASKVIIEIISITMGWNQVYNQAFVMAYLGQL